MDIKRSRRILAVGAPDSGVLEVIKDLTASVPSLNENGSTAGLTHDWDVRTAYYSAKVPIWIDEIGDVDAWKTEFLKPEAKEVVEAIGAWIYCFRTPQDGKVSKENEDIFKAIQEISEEHAGYGADVVMLAVAVPRSKATASSSGETGQAEWEDTCLQYGFEYIDNSAKGTNEFGERTGFARLKEALEANEWSAAELEDDELDLDDLGFDVEDDVNGNTRDEAEMTAELFGVKAALAGHDIEPHAEDFVPPSQQESEVENLDRLMGKLLAVKEQSADMPLAQRKRMAAQAVRDLMKENLDA